MHCSKNIRATGLRPLNATQAVAERMREQLGLG